MAKRGEVRPWRVRYEWPNGIGGTDTYPTEERARECAERLARYVGPDGESRATVTLSHRDRPAEVETIPNPPTEEDE